MPNERSLSQKDIYCMISFVWYHGKYEYRDRKHGNGCWGLGVRGGLDYKLIYKTSFGDEETFPYPDYGDGCNYLSGLQNCM